MSSLVRRRGLREDQQVEGHQDGENEGGGLVIVIISITSSSPCLAAWLSSDSASARPRLEPCWTAGLPDCILSFLPLPLPAHFRSR